MKLANIPAGGLRYWVALSVASILGCNTGDLFATFFGFLNGLPILIALFAAVLITEWRDSRPRELYYWLAVIVVRTAATNLADFAGHQFGDLIALGGVALVLLGIVVVRGHNSLRLGAGPNDLPKVDALYWVTMLFAGILGTGLGDYSAFQLHLGLANGSLILSALVVAFVAVKLIFIIRSPVYYWTVVVAIRTAGTTAGDFFARTLGLYQSTAGSAVLLVALLALWKSRSATAGGEQRSVASPV